MMEKIFSMINIGEDFIVYILLSMLAIVIFASILKIYQLYFKLGDANRVLKRVSKNCDSPNCDSKDGFYGDFLDFLERNRELSPEAIQEVYDAQLIQINKNLSKWNNFLATVGSNAPFIGLFGTVLGVITAFNGLSTGGGDNHVIMAGISTSLIATALGLIVSLPAVFSFNIFKGKQNSIIENINTIFKLFIAQKIESEIKNLSLEQTKNSNIEFFASKKSKKTVGK
ncbi:MotA/TolQ/ExbB proton channel family protein [bacterium]|nr:MotA/TolQ/ExbB proton channel family protein [bacterium]